MFSVLYEEHMLLGAQISPADVANCGAVARYAAPCKNPTALSDLSGSLYLHITNASAPSFINMLCAGKKLAVGECAFEPVLSGNGSLVSICLLIRTGDTEYVLIDNSERKAALLAWLHFVANIKAPTEHASDEAASIFPELEMISAERELVPLALLGPDAEKILNDYLLDNDGVEPPTEVRSAIKTQVPPTVILSTPKNNSVQMLPKPGTCAQLTLDRLTCMVAGLPKAGWLIFCPPTRAKLLWRSFLSFTTLDPYGLEDLAATPALEKLLVGNALLSQNDRNSNEPVVFGPQSPIRRNLVREDLDFIGARFL